MAQLARHSKLLDIAKQRSRPKPTALWSDQYLFRFEIGTYANRGHCAGCLRLAIILGGVKRCHSPRTLSYVLRFRARGYVNSVRKYEGPRRHMPLTVVSPIGPTNRTNKAHACKNTQKCSQTMSKPNRIIKNPLQT